MEEKERKGRNLRFRKYECRRALSVFESKNFLLEDEWSPSCLNDFPLWTVFTRWSSLLFRAKWFWLRSPTSGLCAHVWRTSLEPSYLHEWNALFFFSSSTLTRLNEGYASVCLSRISPCLYGNSIEIGGKLAHAILLMERCTRFGWESLLRTSLSLFLSNRYPLSDCLGIVTSVQSSAPVR